MTRAALVLAVSLLAAACATAPPVTPRPPTAQPGFRALTPQGVELFFDARRQTYAVSGRPDVYWLDGRFFRAAGGGWESSPRVDGPWRSCANADLPKGLR